jgi:DNA-binding LacI/PurR family transcriptional regulator
MAAKIDIVEVARRAGVSIATVSRVINNAPVVREETRQKVLEVLKSTNYRVNAVAKHLRTHRSYNIGIIYTSVMMDFFNTISRGVEEVARKNNYSVFFCNSGDDPVKEENYLSVLFEKRVDGIILAPTGKNAESIQEIMNNDIPVCIIDRAVEGVDTDIVLVNNRSASRKAVDFLIKSGYRRIGFISGPRDRSNAQDRHQGFLDAFRDHGLEPDPEIIRYGDYTFETGYELAGELLTRRGMDALYVANERMGGGAVKRMTELGVALRKDLGFVMWDDPFWTTLVKPNITVISQPVYTIGTTAAEMLFKRIESRVEKEDHLGDNSIKVTLEADLIVRDSA